jgi:pSer/pThr/pTyr-binding forkhead associated (FHA) protein
MDEKFYIKDLNSKNGVFINGIKIEQEAPLMRGALIKIGSTFFRFELGRRS